MPPKWTILIYLICAIMNNIHIYQICEEYFRYETTTNVRIGNPEKIEVPTMTLCVDLPAVLKWNEVSPEILKRLFIRGDKPLREFEPEFDESKAQDMVNNSSLIPSELDDLSDNQYVHSMHYLYDDLTKEMTIPELFKMTHSLENIFYAFSISGLLMNPNRSTKSYDMFMSDINNFQFSIDNIFLHEGKKCFTLNLRTGLRTLIDYLDIRFLKPEESHMLFWQSQLKTLTTFFLHRKEYLVSSKDSYWAIDYRKERGSVFFKSYESIQLEYPYKNYCRDYTKVGLLSQKECIEKCFKNKTVTKFGYVFFESHAFSADGLHVGPQTDPNDAQDIFQECKLHCKELECNSLKHFMSTVEYRLAEKLLERDCSKSTASTCIDDEVDYGKQSSHFIFASPQPFTRTESQPAIPLITFLTGLVSTFGFWLGLAVSDFVHVATKIPQKVKIARSRTRPRATLPQQTAVIRRIGHIILLQQSNFPSRQTRENLR